MLSLASVSSPACEDVCSVIYSTETLLGSLEFSLYVALFSPVFVQQTPVTLGFSDSQLCFLKLEHALGSAWLPSPGTTSWKFKAVTSGNPKANLNCFLSLRDHCPFLFDVYHLKKHCFVYFTCFFCLFVWFWWEGKSGLCQEQNWYAEICNILIRVLTAWNWLGGNYNAGKISYVYWFQFSKLEQGFRITMF